MSRGQVYLALTGAVVVLHLAVTLGPARTRLQCSGERVSALLTELQVPDRSAAVARAREAGLGRS